MEKIIDIHNINFVLVFLEGVLSFFSPCVLPLIPIYMGYLAGSGGTRDENGDIVFQRKKVFFNTLFFILGISFAFFILAMSFTVVGSFFSEHKLWITRIGGIIIVLLGFFQLEIFDFKFLRSEKKIHFKMPEKMTPLTALIMGFTFSFAWSPCIGPMLSSVLIMASGASSATIGYFLVLLYALGFLIPFLLLGLFTTQILRFLKSKQNILKYTIKIGAVILIVMGILMFSGKMNNISGYLNSFSGNTSEDKSDNTEASQEATEVEDIEDVIDSQTTQDTTQETTTESGNNENLAADFTLVDQYGNTHTLSDYRGKVVFINFWATWCPPCNEELPDIEELYQEYNLNSDEVVFLGIVNPISDNYPNNSDVSKEEIIEFLDDKGYTFPVLFDETGDILSTYQISAFPTTFIIDKEGNVVGYVPGMMTRDIMENVIQEGLSATE